MAGGTRTAQPGSPHLSPAPARPGTPRAGRWGWGEAPHRPCIPRCTWLPFTLQQPLSPTEQKGPFTQLGRNKVPPYLPRGHMGGAGSGLPQCPPQRAAAAAARQLLLRPRTPGWRCPVSSGVRTGPGGGAVGSVGAEQRSPEMSGPAQGQGAGWAPAQA